MYNKLREENFKAIETLNVKQKKNVSQFLELRTPLSFFQKPKLEQNKPMYTKYTDIKLKHLLQHFN